MVGPSSSILAWQRRARGSSLKRSDMAAGQHRPICLQACTGGAGIDGMHPGPDPAHMPRIIAGLHRSRTLESVSTEATRPYTDRVKESVFNILRGHIEGNGVLDVFAGVGTMGLEAVSRGASHVVLIEQDARVHATLKRNIELLDCQETAEAVRGDALSSTPLLRAPRPLHVIFLDPPYAMMRDDRLRGRVLEQAAVLGALLEPGGWLVLRSPLNPRDVEHPVDGLDGPEVRTYQKQHAVLFYTRVEDEVAS